MSIAIVTVFVLCLLPVSINSLIIWYQDPFTHLSCSFWIYYRVTRYMANAYCAINPIICFMFSSNYRKALKRLIKCSFVKAQVAKMCFWLKSQRFVEHLREYIYHDYHCIFSSNYRKVLRILMTCSFVQDKSHKCAFD